MELHLLSCSIRTNRQSSPDQSGYTWPGALLDRFAICSYRNLTGHTPQKSKMNSFLTIILTKYTITKKLFLRVSKSISIYSPSLQQLVVKLIFNLTSLASTPFNSSGTSMLTLASHTLHREDMVKQLEQLNQVSPGTFSKLSMQNYVGCMQH